MLSARFHRTLDYSIDVAHETADNNVIIIKPAQGKLAQVTKTPESRELSSVEIGYFGANGEPVVLGSLDCLRMSSASSSKTFKHFHHKI